ncbi:MAG: hypothetical protein FWF63_09840 [Fibromonadales bacterium]|nr:hypothetical protein [Fibromonadales bacterium]
MNKFKAILAATSIAAVLTLSCTGEEPEDEDLSSSSGNELSSGGSSGSGSSTGGTPTGTTYALIDRGIDSDEDAYFEYSIPDSDEYCEEGRYVTEPMERRRYYSINNKTMIWGLESTFEDGDSLMFKGTSDTLIGTWTRTRNKAASCGLEYNYYYGDYYYKCKPDHDITKVVLTDSTVAITRDLCPTDILENGRTVVTNWKINIVNCNTFEYSNGSADKITLTVNAIEHIDRGSKVTYKGKSCERQVPTKAQKQTFCRDALNEDYATLDEMIYNEITQPFYNCLYFEDVMPKEFFGEGGEEEYCDIYPEECEEGGGYDYCPDEDEVFDFCDCDDDCWCYGDEKWTYWCPEEGVGKISAKAKPALKAAKPAISAIKAKPAAKAFKAKTVKANKYSKFFNKKK